MEERFNLYYQLIAQLLTCPEGEKLALLQTNLDLVDLGLLIAMEQRANYFAENNNANTAKGLRKISQWLVEQIGFNSIRDMYQKYYNCLMEILQAVEENPTAEFVYLVLQRNLKKLNFNLAFVLQRWARDTLAIVKSE